MLLWAAAGVPLGVYNIVEEFNIALRIQPQILTTLSLLTWAQCLYYGKVCHHQNIPFSIVLLTKPEIFSHKMLHRSHFSPDITWWHRSRIDFWPESSKESWSPMASYSDGRVECMSPRCWCLETLLGHLRSQNGSRN